MKLLNFVFKIGFGNGSVPDNLSPWYRFYQDQTNKKWLRTVFFCLNGFKCQAPALMINSKGTVKFYPVYF